MSINIYIRSHKLSFICNRARNRALYTRTIGSGRISGFDRIRAGMPPFPVSVTKEYRLTVPRYDLTLSRGEFRYCLPVNQVGKSLFRYRCR
jgi:hypothetical protein